jgi:hypothetical protein
VLRFGGWVHVIFAKKVFPDDRENYYRTKVSATCTMAKMKTAAQRRRPKYIMESENMELSAASAEKALDKGPAERLACFIVSRDGHDTAVDKGYFTDLGSGKACIYCGLNFRDGGAGDILRGRDVLVHFHRR